MENINGYFKRKFSLTNHETFSKGNEQIFNAFKDYVLLACQEQRQICADNLMQQSNVVVLSNISERQYKILTEEVLNCKPPKID